MHSVASVLQSFMYTHNRQPTQTQVTRNLREGAVHEKALPLLCSTSAAAVVVMAHERSSLRFFRVLN